jgi:hypothetical protein
MYRGRSIEAFRRVSGLFCIVTLCRALSTREDDKLPTANQD